MLIGQNNQTNQNAMRLLIDIRLYPQCFGNAWSGDNTELTEKLGTVFDEGRLIVTDPNFNIYFLLVKNPNFLSLYIKILFKLNKILCAAKFMTG